MKKKTLLNNTANWVVINKLPQKPFPILVWLFLIACFFIFFAGCVFEGESFQNKFVTWKGIGPDKWGSVWLIKRHIDPTARIDFLSPGSTVTDATPFDIPDAQFRRTRDKTTYENLLDANPGDDPLFLRMGRIVHDIEINSWGVKLDKESPFVEDAFRKMQKRYGRDRVSFRCYMEFFDNVYDHLKYSSKEILSEWYPESLIPDNKCMNADSQNIIKQKLVQEFPIKKVLRMMSEGKKVVFIDTRETEEFEETHIPHAINIKLREIEPALRDRFMNADLVIPYCVKDFRGFEAARAFIKIGVKKVALLNPYGIKGWHMAGLPIAGENALSEQEAAREMTDCVNHSSTCISNL